MKFGFLGFGSARTTATKQTGLKKEKEIGEKINQRDNKDMNYKN